MQQTPSILQSHKHNPQFAISHSSWIRQSAGSAQFLVSYSQRIKKLILMSTPSLGRRRGGSGRRRTITTSTTTTFRHSNSQLSALTQTQCTTWEALRSSARQFACDPIGASRPQCVEMARFRTSVRWRGTAAEQPSG